MFLFPLLATSEYRTSVGSVGEVQGRHANAEWGGTAKENSLAKVVQGSEQQIVIQEMGG